MPAAVGVTQAQQQPLQLRVPPPSTWQDQHLQPAQAAGTETCCRNQRELSAVHSAPPVLHIYALLAQVSLHRSFGVRSSRWHLPQHLQPVHEPSRWLRHGRYHYQPPYLLRTGHPGCSWGRLGLWRRVHGRAWQLMATQLDAFPVYLEGLRARQCHRRCHSRRLASQELVRSEPAWIPA